MRKLFFVFLFFLVPVSSSFGEESSDILKEPAAVFVKDLSETFINDIFESQKTEQEKVSAFEQVFLDNCDINFISKFVLGKAWRSASEEEKSNFTKSFSESVVLTWAGRFKEYNGQKIVITNVRSANSGQTYVDSEVINPNNTNDKPIALVWRLKKTDTKYQIVDLIVEGVSMTMTYRNEYLSVLQSNNGQIGALIDLLNKKNEGLSAELGVKL